MFKIKTKHPGVLHTSMFTLTALTLGYGWKLDGLLGLIIWIIGLLLLSFFFNQKRIFKKKK